MHSTPAPPDCKAPTSYLVGPDSSAAHEYLRVCPDAQTLTAYSLTHKSEILFILPCGRWGCRQCATQKIKKLAFDVQKAKPNRLLTLTVDPARYDSPRDAWEQTRKCVPLLIRKLRSQFGEVEYLRVTEVTRKGFPHYHLLIRSGFLPHAVVKRIWHQLTGAQIVDLRQVKRSFGAYQYLVKYLSKLHKLEWTERHVSVSRAFVPKDDAEGYSPIEYSEAEFFHYHPANFVSERCQGLCLQRISQHCHLITPNGEPHAKR